MVALAAPLPGTMYAGTRWSTLAYVEKVRPQFLSLRQHFRSSAFSMGGMAANPSIKLGLSKNQTVPESAELAGLLLGDGIFFQSFVPRRFSIIWKVKRQRGNLQPSLPQVRIPVG